MKEKDALYIRFVLLRLIGIMLGCLLYNNKTHTRNINSQSAKILLVKNKMKLKTYKRISLMFLLTFVLIHDSCKGQ